MEKASSANVGAAGEALVVARLLSKGVEVARPFSDNGVDLVAYTAGNFGRAVPIQVKTSSSPRIEMQRKWFQVPGIVLVYVWLINPVARCFVFDGLTDADAVLADSANTSSWQDQGRYVISRPGDMHIERMQQFEEAWTKITARLELSSSSVSRVQRPLSRV